MKKKNKKIKSSVEIIQGMRKNWGTISPVTKVIPNKKKNPPRNKKISINEIEE